jgi:hypothetical protein
VDFVKPEAICIDLDGLIFNVSTSAEVKDQTAKCAWTGQAAEARWPGQPRLSPPAFNAVACASFTMGCGPLGWRF